MVQKRQLAQEEYDVSPKHLKLDHGCHLVSCLQFTNDDVHLQSDKDEGCFHKPINEVEYGYVNGKLNDLPVCTKKVDVDSTLPGRLSTSSGASCTTREEDLRSEAPFQASDPYSYLLELSPLKEVPIGPDYQADIPEWCGYYEVDSKFLGSCVLGMPEDPTLHDDIDQRNRINCYCKNHGSPECVKQHVKEARGILKESIGHKTFAELGFDNMGEMVAEKWSEEDEDLFNEVVYSNPVSVGKNFWNHLAAKFPSRTNQEIVSYYFNVFVLRKRADQNRWDPMNVDSDDDEWQGCDGSEEQDNIPEFDSIKDCYNDLQPRKLHSSCSFDSTSQSSEKTDGGFDFQYDSCISSDTTVAATCTHKVKVDSNQSCGDNEFIFEPLDSGVWDVGHFSCLRSKSDFLPTCSMIEEVFGVESWNFDETDDYSRSN
uniref:uncharacterized protein LOC122589046 n=1 Tax=Erigeron canadensis TaxID=72917 RepID=UPI001CB99C38|nr:uncharacterized protein LOC122589046 [Erigeron canadensis]